jgi:hypothetical protein
VQGGSLRSGEPAKLVGRPFALRATRTGGGPVTAFNAPLQLEVGFSAADLEALEVSAADVRVAQWNGAAWRPLPTQVDGVNELAVAYTDAPGVYALFAGELESAVAAPIFLPVALVIPYVPPALPLLNGDFEAGAANWTQSSSHNWPLIVNSDQVEDLPTHSGIWIAWLGGDDNETATIEQVVTVPPDRPFLTYYYGIASQDACGYDFGRVLVDGAVVEQYTLCRSNNTPDWAYRVVNLSAYAGRTVALQFRATTDGSLNSNLLIDDVAFNNATTVRAAPAPFRWPDGLTR